MSARARLLRLIVLAAALTLAGTITGSALLGWLGFGAFGAAVWAYVLWRRDVRGRVSDREAKT